MSLVVVRVVGSELYGLADTMVSSPSAPQNPYTEGVAKLLILDQRRLVGFAGEFQNVGDVVEGLTADLQDAELLKLLQERSRPNKLDFVVGFLSPSPEVAKISRGEVERGSTAWIGEAEAFELYQRHFHSAVEEAPPAGEHLELNIQKVPELSENVPAPSAEQYSAMFAAFKRVLDGGLINSVAGFVLPVITDRGRLKHPYYFTTWNGQPKMPPPGESIPFGEVEDGAFSVNFGPVGDSVFAAFFDEARTCVVYNTSPGSASRCNPQLVEGDEIDVDLALRERFGQGVPFGRRRSPAHHFVKGHDLATRGQIERALTMFDTGLALALDSRAPEALAAVADSELTDKLGSPSDIRNLYLAFQMRAALLAILGRKSDAASDIESAKLLGSRLGSSS